MRDKSWVGMETASVVGRDRVLQRQRRNSLLLRISRHPRHSVDCSLLLATAHPRIDLNTGGSAGRVLCNDTPAQVGGHDLTAGDGERVAVASILLHPDFDLLTNEANLALITLQQPVQTGKTVGLACLPREGAALQMREALMVQSRSFIKPNLSHVNIAFLLCEKYTFRWAGLSIQAAALCQMCLR